MTEAVQTDSPLRTLHQSRVEDSEIDELGHLSVPFYERRALTASGELLAQHNLNTTTLAKEGIELTLVDTFTRNYREQFLGAPLEVYGGVLDVEDGQIRLYHELVNPERDELAAVFVHRLMLQTVDTRTPVAFQTALLQDLATSRVEWPEHGQPRSLDLFREPFRLDLAEARRRQLIAKKPREIRANECDTTGFLEPGRFQHLAYSGMLAEDGSSTEWVIESPNGKRLGLADLESRNTLLELPRLGDRIQTYSADVALARKTVRRSHWVFNVDSGALLTTGSVVMACLDLEARRAIEITGELRTMFEQRYFPDLCCDQRRSFRRVE